MQLNLTPEQFQALVGLLDVAIKQVGIRAFEDDVAGLMAAVKAAAAQAAAPAEMDDAA